MANIFGWLNSAGIKILHVVEKIPEATAIVAKLLFTGQQVAPEVKTAVTNIIGVCETGSVAILAAVAERRRRLEIGHCCHCCRSQHREDVPG